jgi:hypothetical protein
MMLRRTLPTSNFEISKSSAWLEIYAFRPNRKCGANSQKLPAHHESAAQPS